jgi:hypothetical protein
MVIFNIFVHVWKNKMPRDCLNVSFVCMFFHIDHEIMMPYPKLVKFYMHILDSFLVIWMYSLLILLFWIERYDVIKLSVTMCVTLCYAMFMNFVSMPMLCILPWIFACDSICMLGLTMIFCRIC